ncbi:MAG: tRNA dihydrouridine synthase DusB [Desulfitobacteriaceae bacterium]|nr:tRNA dihydrouridine synthase DusB [Desulfitobacteriaceae bacterium]MDI6878081.1 tRNA dihydrouridine synthase DusB [Desulfitobacteriaceae bacterium]MDI6913951.1 tRNA dihydrouridine synthase DusB [Desulfitobacteriaceae bacterium]
MQLGKFSFDKPVFLAPMAGVTDKAFREVVRAVGGHYVWTEMISDKALAYHNPRTLNMLNLEGEAGPRVVQLFGSDPDHMARAAKIAEHLGADIIDLNMGCPTPKIVKNGEGAALLRDLPRAQAIAQEVVKAVHLPVSVKMRLGWDEGEMVALELGERLEGVGVQMLTLHARTREQFYSGLANWDWTKRLKDKVKIPVIGNGDICDPEEAKLRQEASGCDGLMIGRGALGNPWLLPRVEHYLRTGEFLPEPSVIEKIRIASLHFNLLLRYKGERIGLNEMRKHGAWYVKGLKHAAQMRDAIMTAKSAPDMQEILKRIVEI